MKLSTLFSANLLMLLPFVGTSAAQEAMPATGTTVKTFCDSSISASDCAMSEEVANRIASVITLEHSLHTWPPDLYVHNQIDENGNSVLNAFAHPCGGSLDEGLPIDCTAPDGSTKPHVHFTKQLMDEIVQGDEQRMALIMGHEMAHITLGHTTEYAYRGRAQSELSLMAFGRQQELASDNFGMQYGLAAGYNKDGMTQAFYRFVEIGGGYSSFEGLSISSHPTWDERLLHIDDAKETLWRSMMAFRLGVSMLSAEQYELAANLFRDVVSQFPDSYEAHANLGYAQLMDYIDQLEPADVAGFSVGHLVVGAFTRRPESMEPAVRGVNAALWFQASASLQTALRLKPDMTEAKANLGIAYLVQPQGSNTAEARRLLGEAVDQAQYDRRLDPHTKAAIFINAGVADLAEGLIQESFDRMTSATTELNKINGFTGSSEAAVNGELQRALIYNKALIFSVVDDAEVQSDALRFYEVYLDNTSLTSNWWPLAYNRYAQVAEGLGRTARSIESFSSNHTPYFRTLTGFVFPNGVQVNLGQQIDEILNSMGAAGVTTDDVGAYRLIEDTDLVSYVFFDYETAIWSTQEIVGIQLYGSSAPAVGIQERGLGSDVRYLRIGMSEADLNALLGTDFERRVLVNFTDDYRFYRQLGLGVAISEGHVSELVITQVPIFQLVEPGN